MSDTYAAIKNPTSEIIPLLIDYCFIRRAIQLTDLLEIVALQSVGDICPFAHVLMPPLSRYEGAAQKRMRIILPLTVRHTLAGAGDQREESRQT